MQPRVIARSEATKQSRVAGETLGCFASLAMTVGIERRVPRVMGEA
jgi:hypothetical protein